MTATDQLTADIEREVSRLEPAAPITHRLRTAVRNVREARFALTAHHGATTDAARWAYRDIATERLRAAHAEALDIASSQHGHVERDIARRIAALVFGMVVGGLT